MEEVWRPAATRGDIYEVSNLGQVRSTGKGAARIKRQYIDKVGYYRVGISGVGPIHVHRLVAEAFLPKAGELIRHLDGNPLNNKLDNLAWGTQVDNMADQKRHGTNHHRNKTHCAQGHEFTEENTYIWTGRGMRMRTCRTCARLRARIRAAAAKANR